MTGGGSARASTSTDVGGAACGRCRGHIGHGAGRGVVAATASHERLWWWRWRHVCGILLHHLILRSSILIASPAIIGGSLLLPIARAIGIIHVALFYEQPTIGDGGDPSFVLAHPGSSSHDLRWG